jgi:hypothetical protein
MLELKQFEFQTSRLRRAAHLSTDMAARRFVGELGKANQVATISN